jgi:hypothetical protein
VKPLRTLSTRGLVVLLGAVVVLAAGATAIAVAATGRAGPTPAPSSLDQAIHAGLSAPGPAGITARIKFTNRLFPGGALLGNVGSALMSGASGRLWVRNDGHGRLELQSDAGDVQIVWSPAAVTVYDASSNTVYRAALPTAKGSGTHEHGAHAPPTVSEIAGFLSKVDARANVSGAQPSDVAGRAAYSVQISPKHDGGQLGASELAWDAVRGVPLRLAIFARGSSSPALELRATHISFGDVRASDVEVSPPAGARTVELGSATKSSYLKGSPLQASGRAAVERAVRFPLVAPGSLAGRARTDVRTVGRAGSRGALVTYGQGLGAILVVERKADTAEPARGNLLGGLPAVSLDGVSGHELATQLGTVITWQRGGVSYVLAGSLPPAAAESAARGLR